MSPISHLLRRAFSSSSYSSSSSSPSSSSISRLIYSEPDLQTLVDTFKKYTKNVTFRGRGRARFYERTVQRLANAKRFEWIEEILEEQKEYNDIEQEGFTVRLISLYGKSGMFDHAHKLFDEMPQLNCNRTVLSFNALLGACVSSKNFDKVDGFFRELPGKLSIKPNVVSYNTVIKAFCEMGSLELAILMLDEMEKEGLNPDLITFNTLLDAFYKKGRFLDGEKIWGMMGKYNVVPDIITYNLRLHGLVSVRRIQEVVELVEEINRKGLKPDVFTFNTLFKGLINEGKSIEDAKRWYNVMKRANCEPNRSTFASLLPFACDKNDFLFGAQLCRKILHTGHLNEGALVQKVVDGLVKQSKTEEAEFLVGLGKKSKHSCYHSLKMPKQGS